MAASVVEAIKRGKLVPREGPFGPGKYVIMGTALTDGSAQKSIFDSISASGGKVIKMGFLAEDRRINARRNLFRGTPVESARDIQ